MDKILLIPFSNLLKVLTNFDCFWKFKIARLTVLELTNKNPVVMFELENPSVNFAPITVFKASQDPDSKSSDALWNMIFDIVDSWVPFIFPDSVMVNIFLYKAI